MSAGFALVILSQLAACGGGGSGSTASSPPSTQEGEPGGIPTPKKDPVEIVLYHTGWQVEGIMQVFGDKIKQKFPHVTLTVIGANEKLEKLTTSGMPIDLIMSSVGLTSEVIKYGYQHDISDLIKMYKLDLEQFEPTTIQYQKQLAGGGIYGLPANSTTLTLFYNKDLFDQFGVPYPEDSMTWDETFELAKRMTRSESSTQYFGYQNSFIHVLRLNQLTVPFIDLKTNKVQFGDAKYKTFFDTILKFTQIDGYETSSHFMDVNSFAKNKNVAMMAQLIGAAPSYTKDGVNWDAVSLPTFKEAPGVGPQSYPSYTFMASTSKHKEQAFEIMAYLASDEMQTHVVKNGYLSVVNNPEVNKHFGEDVPELKGKNLKAFMPAKYAESTAFSPYYSLAEKQASEVAKAVIDSKKDLNTALREAEERANKNIEAEMKK